MRLRWTHFLLIVLCAAMAFGGSFSCKVNSGDDDDEDDRPPPSTQPA